ncbi:MAG: class B sortase [Oscillospiraceae bacterium]|nr:class B sortase [Oscillospiraceae bacterium]
MPQMDVRKVKAGYGNRPKAKAGFFPRKGDSAGEFIRKIVLIASILLLVATTLVVLDFYVFGNFLGFFEEDVTENPILVDFDRNDNSIGTITLPENDPLNPGVAVEVPILDVYREFWESNDEFVGFLSLGDDDDPYIHYPVVWRRYDNEFYLNHNFDRVPTRNGTLFTDGWGIFTAPNPITGESGRPDNVVVHGHNIRVRALFHSLRHYVNRDNGFQFLQDNPIIQFDTLFERGTYKIFAVAQMPVLDHLVAEGSRELFPFWRKSHFETSDDFYEYVVELLDRSRFHTDVDLRYGDELLTLATCDASMFGEGVRIVVVARRVREGESYEMNVDEFVNLRAENSGRTSDGFVKYKMFDSYYRNLNGRNGWVGRHSRNWDTSRVEGLDDFLRRNPYFVTGNLEYLND